jgi:hypothetical protein
MEKSLLSERITGLTDNDEIELLLTTLIDLLDEGKELRFLF